LLEIRTGLMQAWATTLDAVREGKPLPRIDVGNIVRIRKRAAGLLVKHFAFAAQAASKR
jgi:hypothetical protein